MLNKYSSGRLESLSDKIKFMSSSATGSSKAELQRWIKKGCVKELNQNLKKVLKVRTIVSTKETQNLLDFYYPSTFIFDNKNHSIEEVYENTNRPILIQGTVGQGKSIALRYLSFYELDKGKSIPVFLELRKLRESTSLFEHIRMWFEKLNLPCSEKLLKNLMQNGFVSLFLDGYDEIKYENRSFWIDEFESIIASYTKVKLLITCRPNTDIHQIASLNSFELNPLTDSDRPDFIRKLVPDEEDQVALITKLSSADKGVKDLLSTPLLMVLFVDVYNSRRKLPNTYSEFFDELFSTILSRHDGLKAAYDRPAKSGFTDKELKLGLESLSYLSRKSNLRQMSESQLSSLAIQSLNTAKLPSAKSKEFLSDIKNITCILKKDGLEYRFIHDSVQEFYSASFVREQEETKEQFYSKYLHNWGSWSPELNFLKYIDEFAFNKYFVIPSVESAFVRAQGNVSNINLAVFEESLLESRCVFYGEKDGTGLKILTIESSILQENWVVSEFFSIGDEVNNNVYAKKVNDFVENELSSLSDIKGYMTRSSIEFKRLNSEKYDFFTCNLFELLNDLKVFLKLHNLIDKDDLKSVNSIYMAANEFVNRHKDIGGVF